MIEGSKRLIVRSLVRSIGQFFRFGEDTAAIRLVSWSETARIIDWVPLQDVPNQILYCTGEANADALLSFLGNVSGERIFILTDGYWPHKTRTILQDWKNGLPVDTIRIIKIGLDSNPLLKGSGVFGSEQFFEALEGWDRQSVSEQLA